jgi:subfamily B ATP-binding cassette protein HlyB/CyaB
VLLGLQPLTTTAYSLRVLRLVGLWQQFQQANLSVQRMGDIMNAPAEPYSILPTRLREGKGQIDIEGLSFRYAENLPFLYEGFNLKVAPGKVIAIMGPSGSGKSTLTKLLQGFYQPAGGTIKIDGCGRVAAQQRGTYRRTPCGCNDIRYLSANELRHYFGVVPQETILF